MYNVHLPIMLESERQAVYKERKKEIQVNVSTNSSLMLDLASFYHFYNALRKRTNASVFTGFPPNFGSFNMNKFPNFGPLIVLSVLEKK